MHGNVEIPKELRVTLEAHGLTEIFRDLTYSKCKEYARQVSEAKAEEAKKRRVQKIVAQLSGQ